MVDPLSDGSWPGVAALFVPTLRALDVPPVPLVLRVDEQAGPVTR